MNNKIIIYTLPKKLNSNIVITENNQSFSPRLDRFFDNISGFSQQEVKDIYDYIADNYGEDIALIYASYKLLGKSDNEIKLLMTELSDKFNEIDFMIFDMLSKMKKTPSIKQSLKFIHSAHRKVFSFNSSLDFFSEKKIQKDKTIKINYM